MRNKWKKRSGEGYIDTCVLILCAMLVIALAVKVLPVYVAKQQLPLRRGLSHGHRCDALPAHALYGHRVCSGYLYL